MALPQPHWSTAHPIGSLKWTLDEARCHLHSPEILVCSRRTEPCQYTWSRCSLIQPPFDQWCCFTSSGLTFCIASTSLSCCWHYCGKQHRGNCWISCGFQGQHQRAELGLVHVDMEALISHYTLPCLELRDTLLLGISDEHQIISLEKLPQHTSVELTQRRFQHQGEKWAEEIALVHTDSHIRLLTVLTFDLQTTIGVEEHALYETDYWSTPRLLLAHFKTFLGTKGILKVERLRLMPTSHNNEIQFPVRQTVAMAEHNSYQLSA